MEEQALIRVRALSQDDTLDIAIGGCKSADIHSEAPGETA